MLCLSTRRLATRWAVSISSRFAEAWMTSSAIYTVPKVFIAEFVSDKQRNLSKNNVIIGKIIFTILKSVLFTIS